MQGATGEIGSGFFSMGRWKCYMTMLMHQAPILFWLLAVSLLGLIATGFIFSPWLGIAALGLSLFIAVMVVSTVIMVYGFNSITGVNMSRHSLTATDADIRIDFEEGDPLSVSKQDVGPYRIYPGGIVVPVEGLRKGWLWVPPKAFENDEDFKQFIMRIYEGNTGKE